jgi:predicted protein tyrosine phosphatase
VYENSSDSEVDDDQFDSKFNPRPMVSRANKNTNNTDQIKVEADSGLEIHFENIHDLIEFTEYSK